MKIYLTLLLSILLLSVVSAAPVSLTPTHFDFNVYPGETVIKSVNITTDGNQAVYINHTSNYNGIIINYTSPLIVEGFKEINITFIFAGDIANGTYNIDLKAETEYATITTTTTSSSGGGSGGGGGVWIRVGSQLLSPRDLNGTYININGTYYYSNGYSFIKQANFTLVNQTVSNVINNTNVDILNTPVNEQTKGFLSLLKDLFTKFWHWIYS
jgi:hypothetical protein